MRDVDTRTVDFRSMTSRGAEIHSETESNSKSKGAIILFVQLVRSTKVPCEYSERRDQDTNLSESGHRTGRILETPGVHDTTPMDN